MEPDAPPAPPVPPWAWAFILPCAGATLLAIDRGASLPPSATPFVDGIRAMVAVVLSASAAFGCALLARARFGVWLRLAGCVVMLGSTLGAMSWSGAGEALVAWRRIEPEAGLSIELPGEPVAETRREFVLGREVDVRTWRTTARGMLFSVELRELPELNGEEREALDLRSTIGAIVLGDDAMVLSERALQDEAVELRVRLAAGVFVLRGLAHGESVVVARAGPLGVDDVVAERFVQSLVRR